MCRNNYTKLSLEVHSHRISCFGKKKAALFILLSSISDKTRIKENDSRKNSPTIDSISGSARVCPIHGKANTRIVYQGVPAHRRKKGRRLVVLAAWRGIKVNERTGATYYFSLLDFYSPLTCALTILLFPPDCESSLRPCSFSGHGCRSPSRQNRTANGTRRGKDEESREERSREEDGKSANCR